MKRPQIETAVFVGLGVGVAAVTHSPALALVAGFVVTLLRRREVDHLTGRAAKSLLQVSVILLGYGLSLQTVWEVGRGSFAITAMSLCITLSLGWLIGRLYRLEKPLSTLISGGTAICGGSAIAALAPAIGAPIGQVGIALTVVFLLNGVALVVFPMIGHWLGMSEVTFGLWSALAIHDTSSVVGAGAAFGAIALAVGTTVKLTRAMWILPVAAISSHLHKGRRAEVVCGVSGVPARIRHRSGDSLAGSRAPLAVGRAGERGQTDDAGIAVSRRDGPELAGAAQGGPASNAGGHDAVDMRVDDYPSVHRERPVAHRMALAIDVVGTIATSGE
jgi:MFS family permease